MNITTYENKLILRAENKSEECQLQFLYHEFKNSKEYHFKFNYCPSLSNDRISTEADQLIIELLCW